MLNLSVEDNANGTFERNTRARVRRGSVGDFSELAASVCDSKVLLTLLTARLEQGCHGIGAIARRVRKLCRESQGEEGMRRPQEERLQLAGEDRLTGAKEISGKRLSEQKASRHLPGNDERRLRRPHETRMKSCCRWTSEES